MIGTRLSDELSVEDQRDPGSPFDLYVFAALLRLRAYLPGVAEWSAQGGPFPFLGGYFDQLPTRATSDGDENDETTAWWRWCALIERVEGAHDRHQPTRALREDAGLDHVALSLLFTAGLVDEDARFGPLFHALQPEARQRPTVGLLSSLGAGPSERRSARRAVARLLRLGLLQPVASDAPSSEDQVRPSPAIWDVLRGDARGDIVSWARFGQASDAPAFDELVLDPSTERRVMALPSLVREGVVRTVVVRGPRAVGRRTVLAALGRTLGLGHLDVDPAALDGHAMNELGALATALQAMPILRFEPERGRTVEIPQLEGYAGPIGIVLPDHGGVSGPDLDRSVTVTLPMPAADERRRHWLASTEGQAGEELDTIARGYRLTGGHIRRVASMARTIASVEGRAQIGVGDVQEASRALRARALETLAPYLPTTGDWTDLVVDDETRRELQLLTDRCRAREELTTALPPSVGLRSSGVRVLFTGPSGTGKTMAARILASVLGMDLHALDVSSVVDKYIGETEKNLTTVFSNAAELDALLLLDEGDALLTRRTDVTNSNDRYANLQTNHLLQQLEVHPGIVVITTNAGDRIDAAFQRRFDVIVEFRSPDALQRWELWRRLLPADHRVDERTLAEIATRCALTGGQIRNAVLRAWLLALDEGGMPAIVSSGHVLAAARREFRKIGAVFPLAEDEPAR